MAKATEYLVHYVDYVMRKEQTITIKAKSLEEVEDLFRKEVNKQHIKVYYMWKIEEVIGKGKTKKVFP